MAANIFWGRTPLSMPPRGGSKNFQGDSPESFRDGIFAEGRRRADGGSCGISQRSKIPMCGENCLDKRQILPKKNIFRRFFNYKAYECKGGKSITPFRYFVHIIFRALCGIPTISFHALLTRNIGFLIIFFLKSSRKFFI